MKIQTVALASLSVDPANVRRHPGRNLDAIKASLLRFGQQKPIVVDGKGIVRAGNGTIEAARALGWDKVAVVRTDLAGSEATAYAIADNRTSELAEWDGAALAEVLRALQSEDFPLDAIGYTDDEVDGLIKGLGDEALAGAVEDQPPPIDKADELLKKWRVEAGQLWDVPSKATPGKAHRLLCGDSTKAEDVARVMGSEKADLMATDPPYGVAVAGGTHDPRDEKNYRSGGTIDNDSLTGKKLQAFLESAFRPALAVLRPGAAWYTWYAGTETRAFLEATETLGGMRHVLVWVKPNFVFGRCDYHYRHEPVMYGWTPGAGHVWYGSRDQDSVFETKADGVEKKLHPTVKPVELFVRPIMNHTKPGELVYEPFTGSGSQFVAAEQAGRLCRGIEVAPKYCAVALERLANLGLAPHLTQVCEQVG